MRVLCVDDDPVARRLLAIEVERSGHEPVEAAGGEAAWEIFAARLVDMVITDWSMPDLDGLALVERIRRRRGTRHVYVMMVTARTDRRHVLQGLEAGVDDYLTKPFDRRELRARIAIGARTMRLHQELRKALRRQRYLARHDDLTGLCNRRHLEERGHRALARARRGERPLSLILVDVDRFKGINDALGHTVGDEVLIAVGERISDVRETDVVARWGGDEFVVLLPDTDLEGAHVVLERLRTRLARTLIPTSVGPLRVTASFGAAVTTHGMTRLEQLITRADESMYDAKDEDHGTPPARDLRAV